MGGIWKMLSIKAGFKVSREKEDLGFNRGNLKLDFWVADDLIF
jgi:hypothetical protein